jgi:hypothetical protein
MDESHLSCNNIPDGHFPLREYTVRCDTTLHETTIYFLTWTIVLLYSLFTATGYVARQLI